MSYICLWLVTLHMTRSMHCFITNEKDFCNSETNNSSSDDFSVQIMDVKNRQSELIQSRLRTFRPCYTSASLIIGYGLGLYEPTYDCS